MLLVCLVGLLLLALVIRVVAGGMVGDIDHLGESRDRLEDDPLDSLLQGDLSKTTALTSSEQPEVGNRPVHRYELCSAAVGGDRGIHLLEYDLLHLFDERTRQIARRSRHRRRGRAVRVVHRETLIGQLEEGAVQFLPVIARKDQCQTAVSLDDPPRFGVFEADEGELVGELGPTKTRHLYRQGELALPRFLISQLENHVEGVRSDAEDGVFGHLPGW